MQICQFYIDSILYGIDVSEVLEIMRYQNETRVPLADQSVSGLINLRGQIITAIDLRSRLSIDKTKQQANQPMCLVVKDIEGPPVSLVVDRVGDVIDIEQHDLELTPETVPANYRNFVDGVVKLEDSLRLMLNLRKTLHFH